MTLLFPIYHGGSTGAVTLPNTDFTTASESSPVYSGVRFDADGNMYKRNAAGSLSQYGVWLLNGAAGDFYLGRTIDDQTLDTDAGGTTSAPILMSTDRDYDIQVTLGQRDATVTFYIYTDSGGVSQVASETMFFDATKDIPE